MDKLSNWPSKKTPVKRLLRSLLGPLLLQFLPLTISAEPANRVASQDSQSLCLVGSGNAAFNETFIQQARQAADESLVIMPESQISDDKPCGLLITIGTPALTSALTRPGQLPIIATYIGQAEFSALASEAGENRPMMAIYDQPPLAAQAALGRAILPAASRVALLASPQSRYHYNDLLDQLPAYGLKGQIFVVENEKELIQTLGRALNYGDFLLGTPEPEIFNPRTIKHILLTAYRHNRIVIGPQRAYVRAGSLASIYVPLRNVAEITIESARQYLETGKLPKPSFPADYSVEVNRQVARSLSILVPDNETLVQQVRERIGDNAEVGKP